MYKFLCFCTAFVLALSAFAQPVTVSGKVIDESGLPLYGASIAEAAKKNGTSTRQDGTFTLVVADSTSRLIISYVGYLRKEISVRGQYPLIISLVPTVPNLNDVVLIGYGTARKRDLTGAIGSVSSKDFNKGVITSPDQLIQGKVSGVQITSNNGQPGGAAAIKVRGNSALVGLGQPLFVIDGIPLDGRSLKGGNNADPNNNFGEGITLQGGVNPLSFINPDDIQSIEVLKDASATAIYGSRAAYGVVLINTKKGVVGEPKITVGISAGFSSIMRKIKVLDAGQYRDAIAYYGVSDQNDKGSKADAMDSILQKGFQQNYTMAISGGNENGKYRVSGNYLSQEGILKKTGFNKYGMDITTGFRFLPSKKLGFDLNLITNQFTQNGTAPVSGSSPVVTTALAWNPTRPFSDNPGNLAINPLNILNYAKDNLKVTTAIGSIAPSFRIKEWLEYKLLVSINYASGINRSSVKDTLARPYGEGSASISNTEQITKQLTQTLNFHKDILPGLNLNALAGYEYMHYDMKGSYVKAFGVPGTGFGNYGLDYTNYIQFSNVSGRLVSSFANPTYEIQSYFGRTIFNYKDKYLLTATFRADGSSKFGDNHKYGYFPSFAAAWYISNEKFFNLDFVNSMKIRGGWGKTGNQEFPSGASQTKYSFFDNGALTQVNSPNPDLKWQSDNQYNFGLDFSILQGRITATLDYFNKTTTDLLFPGPPIQPAPPQSVVRWVNLDGKIVNKGFEFLVNASLVKNKDWSWDLSVNGTFLKNKVSDMPSPILTGWLQGSGTSGTSVEVIQNGLPMNAFYTRKFLGLDKNTGFSVYEDNGNTFYYVGNPNPSTLAGLSTTLQYKKFSLGLNMYGSFGQDIFYNTLLNVINVGKINVGGNIGLSVYQDPVKESVANPVTPSSRFIMKGNYFKLSNMTLAYDLGTVGKAFKESRIYLTGQNLFNITSYPGFDPEANYDINNYSVPSLGIDYAQYPTARIIVFGINFSL